jgi:hypothetical protein
MAMQDTIGQASAMTGGYGNSYAATAGNQAYQGYLQQLNDRVPELYQMALNQYNQEYQNIKDQASILNTLVQQDHSKYRESVSDFYKDLEYNTGIADSLSKSEYEKWADDIGLKFDIYTNQQDQADKAKKYAYDTALSMLSLGVTPSAEMLAQAGISANDAKAIANKVLSNEEKASISSSGGNNKAYSMADYEEDRLTDYIMDEDWAAVDNYINVLRSRGLSDSEAMYWLARIPSSYYTVKNKDKTKSAQDRYYDAKTKQTAMKN